MITKIKLISVTIITFHKFANLFYFAPAFMSPYFPMADLYMSNALAMFVGVIKAFKFASVLQLLNSNVQIGVIEHRE